MQLSFQMVMKLKRSHRYLYLILSIFLFMCGKENTPPIANFTWYPSRGDSTTTFLFDASLSSDNENYPDGLLARWDWESDGVWDTEYSNIKNIFAIR